MPDWTKPFILDTNTCEVGIGAFYLNVTLMVADMLLHMPADCSQGLKEIIVSHTRNFKL